MFSILLLLLILIKPNVENFLAHVRPMFAVTPDMDLKPNSGSDRAWVWNTLADYADECPKAELLAIRFLNAESEY